MNEAAFNRMMQDVRNTWHLQPLPPGEWITVKEAAERLGITQPCIHAAIRHGSLSSVKHKTRRMVNAQSVEQERKRRAYKPAKRTNHSPLTTRRPTPENIPASKPPHLQTGLVVDGLIWIDHATHDVWAPSYRACKALNITPCQLNKLARAGKLRRRWADTRTSREVAGPSISKLHESSSSSSSNSSSNSPNSSSHLSPSSPFRPLHENASRGQRRNFHTRAMYSLNEIENLAEKRSHLGRNRTTSPNDPERKIWPGRIRTKLDPPPGDALITRAEAAMLLGVSTMRISAMVLDGALFGWQAEPGKQGSRLYLSANQVNRLSQNEEHIRRNQAWRKGRERCSIPGKKQSKEWKDDVEFRFERQMSAQPGKALKHDHGEYYSTSQAAQLLGVNRGTIRNMRRRGTLKGYRSPNSRATFNRRRYWFFKKDEVDALQHNEDRLRRRKAYLKRRYPWIYGDEAQMETYSQPKDPEYRPHEWNPKQPTDSNPFEELREGMRIW